MQALADVAVDIQGDRHIGVAQPLLNDLGMLTGGQRQRGPGMPKIMKPDRRQSDLGRLSGEHPREPLRMQRPAVRPAEHQKRRSSNTTCQPDQPKPATAAPGASLATRSRSTPSQPGS